MITVVKVNVITDDAGMPVWLKERLNTVLQDALRDDPETPDNAIVQLEWKETVSSRAYMQSLVGGNTVERIKVQPEPAKALARKRARR